MPMPHLNNKKTMVFGEVRAMGHAPFEIPQIWTAFKFFVPLLATSHGGGALVVVVVMGPEVPGSNPGLLLHTHIFVYIYIYIYIYIYLTG
jgi:hypothetical protein